MGVLADVRIDRLKRESRAWLNFARSENAAETLWTIIVISRLRTVMITAKAMTVSRVLSICDDDSPRVGCNE